MQAGDQQRRAVFDPDDADRRVEWSSNRSSGFSTSSVSSIKYGWS
jgi:hypothetical protein